jgi:hypothetical protein
MKHLVLFRRLCLGCALASICAVAGMSAAAQVPKPKGLEIDRGQKRSSPAAWPCTGPARSFDPTYGELAEATGGHLMLFDPSELDGVVALAAGDAKHQATIARAFGRSDGNVELHFWVDSSVESVFVAVTLACMAGVDLIDPQGASVGDGVPGVDDHWFRAVRLATVPTPRPGEWILRLLGSGSYSLAIQAQSAAVMSAQVTGTAVTVDLGTDSATPMFRLVDAGGAPIQELALAREGVSSRYTGTLQRPSSDFRVQAVWTTVNGETVQRTDARLERKRP